MDLKLDANAFDYAFVVIYFAFIVAIGIISRRRVHSSEDFFLSGRSLPAWVTAIAFISANIGAVELIGQAANGAQYGLVATHYYWVGAIPAMVFLGVIMMPFFYGSKVRSVPEYLRLRFNTATHLFQSIAFSVATVLVSGINLFALAILVNVLVGWPLGWSIVLAAGIVLLYTGLGGLTAAVYNEVLQFLIIVAFLVPLTVAGLARVGGIDGFVAHVRANPSLGPDALHAWAGTSITDPTNPFGNWLAIVLGLGFVTSFGYWCTNFTEVQRALSAKDMNAARRTPILAAIPKMFLPAIIIVPGLIVATLIPTIGTEGLPYNEALPALIGEVLPNGLIGLALAGLMAAFMAGMAANVSSFNTVVTYDLWQTYIRPGKPDLYYLKVGRRLTVVGVLISIATAFIAARFNNLQDYIQSLQSFFNAPLFATFIIGMMWKRMTPWAGFWGLVFGVLGAAGAVGAGQLGWMTYNSTQSQAFISAGVAFVADAVVTVAVTLATKPKPVEEMTGLVWGTTSDDVAGARPAPDLAALRRQEAEALADGSARAIVLDRTGAECTVERVRWFENPTILGVLVLLTCIGLNVWLG